MLGFRINLYSHDPIILRVGRPNEKKSWVENIEKVNLKNNSLNLTNETHLSRDNFIQLSLFQLIIYSSIYLFSYMY